MTNNRYTRDFQRMYNKWFMREIEAYLKTNKTKGVTYKKYLETNCFFVTMTFSSSRIGLRQNRQEDTIFPLGSIQLQNFHHWYVRTCQQVFGQNYRRKSKPKIFAIACLDADGTKHGSCATQDGFENIHLHAIIILPPETSHRFLNYLDSDVNHLLENEVFDCDKIQVKPFTVPDGKRSQEAMGDLVSYSTKFMRFNCTSLQIGEEFRLYPEALRTHEYIFNLRPEMKNMNWRKKEPLNMMKIKTFGL
jgi:hypothetical protein